MTHAAATCSTEPVRAQARVVNAPDAWHTMTVERMTLMKMEGSGRVYFADRNNRVHLRNPVGESLCVNGNDLLALTTRARS